MDVKIVCLLLTISANVALAQRGGSGYPSGGGQYPSSVGSQYPYGSGQSNTQRQNGRRDREQVDKHECPRMPACTKFLVDATERMTMMRRENIVGPENCRDEDPEQCWYKDWLRATENVAKPSYQCWKQLDAMFRRPITRSDESSSRL